MPVAVGQAASELGDVVQLYLTHRVREHVAGRVQQQVEHERSGAGISIQTELRVYRLQPRRDVDHPHRERL